MLQACGSQTNFPSGKRRLSSVVASRNAMKHGSRRSIVAAIPILVTTGFHASMMKFARRAPNLFSDAKWIAGAGRELSCIQKRVSQALILERTNFHASRFVQAMGGGSTIRTLGRSAAIAENKGGMWACG